MNQQITTKKRINPKLQRPIIMYDALALIFTLNAFWSFIVCTYSNPMVPAYFTYIKIMDHLTLQLFALHLNLLVLLAVILTITALVLHFTNWWSNDYFNYGVILLDVLAITFMISPHWTGKSNLTYINLLFAFSFFALALTNTFSAKAQVNDRTYLYLGLGLLLVSLLVGLVPFLHLTWRTIIIGLILVTLIVGGSWYTQNALLRFLNQDRTAALLNINLAAISHLPAIIAMAVNSDY